MCCLRREQSRCPGQANVCSVVVSGTAAELQGSRKRTIKSHRLLLRPLSLHPVIDAAAKKPTYKDDNQKIDQLHRSPTHGAGWSDVHVAFSFAQHKQCGPRQAHNQEQTPTCHPTGPNQSAILLRHSASLCLLRPVRNVVVSGRSGTAAKLGRADVWRRS